MTDVAKRTDMAPLHVIHVAGRVTDAVFSFLGPATAALDDLKVRQTLIHVDDADYGDNIRTVRAGIALRPVDARNPVDLVQALSRALVTAIDTEPASALHLHGVLPSLAGALVARHRTLRGPVYFSPHASRLLCSMRLVGAPMWLLLRRWSALRQQLAIATVEADVQLLRSLAGAPSHLVESPVDPIFFGVVPSAATEPIVLAGTSTWDNEAAARFAQLAVLLGEDLPLQFVWLGPVATESTARLKAAGISQHRASSAVERAHWLSVAALYIAPAERGFPLRLAEAMAAGSACIAWDSPYSRTIIEHGRSGLVCDSPAQMLAAAALLLSSSDMRTELGQAARVFATARFETGSFNGSLMAAYGMDRNALP